MKALHGGHQWAEKYRQITGVRDKSEVGIVTLLLPIRIWPIMLSMKGIFIWGCVDINGS